MLSVAAAFLLVIVVNYMDSCDVPLGTTKDLHMEPNLRMGPWTLSVPRPPYPVSERQYQTLGTVWLLPEKAPSFAEETAEEWVGHLVSWNREILFAIDLCTS